MVDLDYILRCVENNAPISYYTEQGVLDLSSEGITDEDLQRLAQALEKNTTLQGLNLSGNKPYR